MRIWGYGFPIGGVAAFDPEQGGIICAGRVGFDISCGVRCLRTNLQRQDLDTAFEELADQLFQVIPAGVGKQGKIKLDIKQFLLINIARIFESEANKQLPPPPGGHSKEKEAVTDIKESYWQDFCGAIQELKVNFKNCLLVISRFLEKLVVSVAHEKISWLSKMLVSISRVRQRIRLGRHVPRSYKPMNKWRTSNATKKISA